MTYKNSDIDILARTIYGEARGEFSHPEGGLAALISVANVVMNRLKYKTWYGLSIREVCQKPWQFSCWNPNDPNHTKLHSAAITTESIFDVCREVADHVAHGRWPDLTKGSDHYHLTQVSPKWSKGEKPLIRIGHHLFYKLKQGSAK